MFLFFFSREIYNYPFLLFDENAFFYNQDTYTQMQIKKVVSASIKDE